MIGIIINSVLLITNIIFVFIGIKKNSRIAVLNALAACIINYLYE